MFRALLVHPHERPHKGHLVHCVRFMSVGCTRIEWNWCLVALCVHHATRHIMPIHNIPSTAPQVNIFQKALGTLPEDDNVMPKHVGATIHN
jgi:hypothetical protein